MHYFHTEGAFLVKDDRVLKGPLGRSLRLFAHTTRSSALRSVHRLAHSLLGICVHAVIAFHGNKRVFGAH